MEQQRGSKGKCNGKMLKNERMKSENHLNAAEAYAIFILKTALSFVVSQFTCRLSLSLQVEHDICRLWLNYHFSKSY